MPSRMQAWRRRADRLPDELQQHVDQLMEERIALGDTPDEAERFARRKLGNCRLIEEDVHAMTPFYPIEAGMRHIRLAARTLLRNKAVYLAAAGILALGIGMGVAMFSLVEAVLLKPLPFSNQQSIDLIWKVDPLAGTHVEELAYPELGDIQQNIPDFAYVAVMPTSLYGYARVLQTGNAEPVQIEAAPVSHDFFKVLGVAPALGRDFTASDEYVGAPPVVLLSDRVWRDNLNADLNVVGQMIRLNGQGHRIIGVMAEGVEFPRGAGLWVPLGVDQAVVTQRGATFLQAIALAKPGIARSRIEHEIDNLFRRLAHDHPEAYTTSQRGVVTPLVEYWTGSARIHLWVMLAASLLLFCASLISAANLLLSRAIARQYEIATRIALGAARLDILLQLGAEGLMITFIAIACGLAVAEAALRLIVICAPADIPRLSQSTLDFGSFCFAAAAAFVAAMLCVAIPGFAATGKNLESVLREGGTRSSLSRRDSRTRSVFILVQSTLTVVLLSAAVLLCLSYRSMMAADVGFGNRDAVTMNLQLRGPGLFGSQGYDRKSRRDFYTRLLNHLRETPGVTSAAAVLLRPLEGAIGWDVPYEFEFEAAVGARSNRVAPKSNFEVITPDYFRTVGTPLLEGRDFNAHDAEDAEPVAIVSRKLAERIRAAGYRPIGYRIHLGIGAAGWTKIVGVSADARYRNITQPGTDIFVPYLQASPHTNYVAIRGSQDATALAALVRRTLTQMDPTQAIAGVSTIGQLVDANAARHRFNMFLLLWFAICAAILAAAGVYSAIAEMMAAKRPEIAIRIALGAQRSRLVRDLVTRTLVFVVVGEVLAVFVLTAVRSAGAELLYGVSARNPIVLGATAALVFAISLAAAFWPAWRAAGADPQASLRAN